MKTAFVTCQGFYQFKVTPFVLCNEPTFFKHLLLMEQVQRGLQWETCIAYLDDISMFGKTVDTVMNNVQKVHV